MDKKSDQELNITNQVTENITPAEELAYELHIEEVMSREILSLYPDMQMQEALEFFRTHHISGAPVISRDGDLIGVLSMEDLIRALRVTDLEAPVEKYMSVQLISVRGKDPVVEALKKFVTKSVGRLPVIDDAGNLIGILTKGDITRGLLKALQRDYQVEEVRRYRARHLFEDIVSDRTSLILRYNIKAHDFTRGGAASTNIKRALLRLGASPQLARRVGIAIYEAEMNLIIHTTYGGIIRVEIEPHQISIDVYDDGPGIKDVNLAMKPGYSTATEEVRELGFGAGMGLVNISRCVDQMKLESVLQKGTRLRLKIFLKQNEIVGEGYPANRENS
ncbi:MAG TPA: CBS domain-containing protein [Anaerolineaceae bacterium]|nr:CBS domain-containing protein [Anaerolineaceae bacterium]